MNQDPQLKDRFALIDSLPPGGCTAEIGVLRGDFSAYILSHAAPRRHFCIDPWSWSDRAHGQVWGWGRTPPGAVGSSGDDCYQFTLLRFWDEPNVSILRTTSLLAVKLFPEHSLDFVYLDGDHRQEVCAAELAAYVSKVRPGGIIAGHDFNEAGVRLAVAGYLAEHPGHQLHVTAEPVSTFWFHV